MRAVAKGAVANMRHLQVSRGSMPFQILVPHVMPVAPQTYYSASAWPSASPSPYAAVRSLTVKSSSAPGASPPPPSWDIRMLYDGDCPLCMREVDMLRVRDSGKGKIDFVDIAAANYSAADNAGISFEEAMGRIHAILPDGKIVTDVEVFRRLYEAVGLGWIYAITKVEAIGRLADWVYGFWAKYRMEVTFREPLSVILEKRRTKGMTCADADAACEIPAPAKDATKA